MNVSVMTTNNISHQLIINEQWNSTFLILNHYRGCHRKSIQIVFTSIITLVIQDHIKDKHL
jgi:hypothetical protein